MFAPHLPGRHRAAWSLAATLVLAAGAAGQLRLRPQRIANNFDFTGPLFLGQPPGETHRLYVVQKSGLIRVVKDDVVLADSFIDVTATVNHTQESGLLGLAFHPQFQANGLCYVYYNRATEVVVERYTTDPANPEGAGSPKVVVTIPRTPGFHNGGWLGFGPDGYLYIASGDGANQANSQDLSSLLGKMLRIDVDHDDFPADPLTNYAIPPTNPLAGATAGADEIWALGLRNPWRNSFDRATGDFWISDVGYERPGEVNFQAGAAKPPFAARNYGWPCMDGSVCFAPPSPTCTCNSPTLTQPVFDYDYAFGGTATIGGYVYRGNAIPALRGAYVFCDLLGSVWSFRSSGGPMTDFVDHSAEFGVPSPVSFGQDTAGELYLVSINGGVYKIKELCYPNCDGSTTPPALNIADLSCFLNAFAAGNPYANCDGSSMAPTLNIFDFGCMLNRFSAGCS